MKVPCEECIAFAACKSREVHRPKFFHSDGKWENDSIYNVAANEDCDLLKDFIDRSDQDDINRARELFEMEPYL